MENGLANAARPSYSEAMNTLCRHSRREFLARAVALPTVVAAGSAFAAESPGNFAPPIALFSKVCREAGLSLEQSADLVGAAGLDGVDCPVRPRDEILPERVKEDLPRYAELLAQRGRKVLLVTTAITDPDSPHARDILDTARRLGVRWYRLGSPRVPRGASVPKLVAETRAQLKTIAALNAELGLCALLQNHSPGGDGGYLYGDLDVLAQVLEGFEARQVAAAFDLGHALLVHGDGWADRFDRLRPQLGVVYVKDTHRQRRFVPFGEGEFGQTDWFKRLKALRYSAPISLHIEFNWDDAGKARTREALLKAATDSTRTLRGWLAAA